MMVSGNVQSSAIMIDAPSSQASATGSSMFINQQKNSRQKSYSGSGSQRSLQVSNAVAGDIEERKNGMGPPKKNDFGHYEAMGSSLYNTSSGNNGIGNA